MRTVKGSAGSDWESRVSNCEEITEREQRTDPLRGWLLHDELDHTLTDGVAFILAADVGKL
jgi:hypothetical protein